MVDSVSRDKLKEALKSLETLHGYATIQMYKASSDKERVEYSGKMEAYQDALEIVSILLEGGKPKDEDYPETKEEELIRISREQRKEHGPEVGLVDGEWIEYD